VGRNREGRSSAEKQEKEARQGAFEHACHILVVYWTILMPPVLRD
jgi:hypothetical protein